MATTTWAHRTKNLEQFGPRPKLLRRYFDPRVNHEVKVYASVTPKWGNEPDYWRSAIRGPKITARDSED